MGIYAGWTAHREGFSSANPYSNRTGELVLIIAGECYVESANQESTAKSADNSSRRAEAILDLYEKVGEEFVQKLNGLFSGLLIDRIKNRTFLFNDRFGVERIYCHQTHSALFFASEAKALLRILPQLRIFDQRGLTEYLTFGCTLDNRTLFKDIGILPGGSLWRVERGSIRQRQYFSPSSWESQAPLSEVGFLGELERTFKEILPRYIQNNLPVGIALTAGLDTRMIMAGLSKLTAPAVCYTFVGQEGITLDGAIGARIARSCGLEHHLLRIEPEFFSNFSSFADETVYISDGSFGITGSHEIYFNAAARSFAPVRLTGNYGGEVLRGVSTFKKLPLDRGLFSGDVAASVEACVPSLDQFKKNQFAFAAFAEVPWNLFGSLAAGRSQLAFRTPYLDNRLVALSFRTPPALRKSREPGFRLVANLNPALNAIPTDMAERGTGSALFASVRQLSAKVTFKLDYLNNEGLPHWMSPFEKAFRNVARSLRLVGQHKFLHYRSGFREELASYIRERINDPGMRRFGMWNRSFIDDLGESHISGKRNRVLEINTVLTIEAIDRLLFRDLPRTLPGPRAELQERLVAAV